MASAATTTCRSLASGTVADAGSAITGPLAQSGPLATATATGVPLNRGVGR